MADGLSAIENYLKCRDIKGINSAFTTLERKSIDYSILEKADNIIVVPADFSWDDVGTWAALERICTKDNNGNIIKGEAITIDSTENIIHNTIGDKLLIAFGVKDLVIVNSHDVILIAEKKASADLKRVLKEVQQREKITNLEGLI